jgi:RNA 3'-phosphate cyclase
LDYLEIDGSFGEGGGQTIRIATSLAVILERSIRVTKVRAGRRIPGLRPQHVATLKILSEICGGTLEGCKIGSTEFTFVPGKVESRSMAVDTGTAASVTLVLQAIVPAISLSGASLDLELTGGTDVPWSPTCDYFSGVVSTALHRLGIAFDLKVSRRGYYPSGGGKVNVHIDPCRRVQPVDYGARKEDPPISVVSRAGLLPERVAEKLLSSAVSQLERKNLRPGKQEVHMEESSSPGCSLLISAVGESCFIGADGIGVRGKPAFAIGSDVGRRFVRSYTSGACIDPHLADMMAPLLFLAGGPSRLLIPEASSHLRTSLHIVKQFVPAEYSMESRDGAQLVSITPPRQNS